MKSCSDNPRCYFSDHFLCIMYSFCPHESFMQERACNYSHLIDDEIAAWRDEIVCPGSCDRLKLSSSCGPQQEWVLQKKISAQTVKHWASVFRNITKFGVIWASSIPFHDSPSVTHHFATHSLTLDRILFLWVSWIFRQLVQGKTCLKIFCIMVRSGQLVGKGDCAEHCEETQMPPWYLLPEVFVFTPAHHSQMHMPVSSQTLSPAISSSLQPVLVSSGQGQWE